MMKSYLFSVLILSITTTMAQKTYLALGDSYTIGEGLEKEDSWPHQLLDILSEEGLEFNEPEIIAKTGWRTDELLTAVNAQLNEKSEYDLVSLSIGVNNQYQEKPYSQFCIEFEELLQKAISVSKNENEGVFVLSIPNYSVTPFAKEKNKTGAQHDLLYYNDFAKEICKKYNVAFYDIFHLSSDIGSAENMLIEDKLHPNKAQYRSWINAFYPELIGVLK